MTWACNQCCPKLVANAIIFDSDAYVLSFKSEQIKSSSWYQLCVLLSTIANVSRWKEKSYVID